MESPWEMLFCWGSPKLFWWKGSPIFFLFVKDVRFFSQSSLEKSQGIFGTLNSWVMEHFLAKFGEKPGWDTVPSLKLTVRLWK